jgi:hypothetical protein
MIEKWSRQLSIMLGSCSMLTGPVVCHVCMNTDRVLNLSPAVLKYSSSILMACVGRGGSKKQGLSSPVSSWNSLRAYVVYLSLITDMSNFSALVALQKKKTALVSCDKKWKPNVLRQIVEFEDGGWTDFRSRFGCYFCSQSEKLHSPRSFEKQNVARPLCKAAGSDVQYSTRNCQMLPMLRDITARFVCE